MRAPELTIVLPAFNEAANIPKIVEKVGAAMGDISHEIIVVDDNSPDGTTDVTRNLARDYLHVRCIRRVYRHGLSGACLEGMMAANAPVCAIMDADLQHDETRLTIMLAQIKSGADLVVGSRYVDGGTHISGFQKKTRVKGSEVATRLANYLTGDYTTDPMSGFFMLTRKVADMAAENVSRDGFKILFDIVSRYGSQLKIAEVPYQFRERQEGESKLGFLVTIQFIGLLVSRFTGGLVPMRFMLYALVGLTGLGVHMATLYGLVNGAGVDFANAQFLSAFVAMTSNFILNNEITYAHRKLKGYRFWYGLITFYLICSIGAVANVSVAVTLFESEHSTAIAGFAGAMMNAVFNYAVTKLVTWRDT